jgi:glycosyltransferase involved in cell wall biosynthesis
MKVLHVYRTYFPDPPGGMQEAIRQICLSTKPYGVENTVFALSPHPDPEVIERPEAKVVRCRSWAAPASCNLGGLEAFSTFRSLVQQADVVHYLFPWPFADLLHEVAPKKPSVLTYVSDIIRQRWLSKLYEPLMWRTLRGMDVIVSNAPRYAATSPVLSHHSLSSKVQQIPLGILESSYTISPDHSILSRLGIGDQEPFILFVGVLRYYKGLHTLLDACADTQSKVVIAGSGPEGAALVAQARRLGLTNVVFAGQVTKAEKVSLLKACRALVLPSHLRSEAYGMVLVEASMFAKPMISCDISTGTSFVNEHKKTGFVVKPESPNELAEAMNILLTDDSMAKQFGLAARIRYENFFSGLLLGQAYLELYKKII